MRRSCICWGSTVGDSKYPVEGGSKSITGASSRKSCLERTNADDEDLTALGIRVVPLVGPSSILLGLMGSGLNGQSFAFHGYLPVAEGERDGALRTLEDESRKLGRTQIFIETPYRNERMLDALLRTLKPETRLCVACELNTADEFLLTRSVREWKKAARPALARRPALFLLLA